MKKVGFIDYYLNEWHADNYPAWIKDLSNGEFEVKYGWAQIDSPNEGGLTNAQWCEKYCGELLGSIDELIEKSDCIIVLAPDDTDKHLELSLPAVKSGKPVFIDKTFCCGEAEAIKIFETAKESGSPCFSTSAMRFSPKLAEVRRDDINTVMCFGHLEPDTYIIHQLEPLAILMGTDVERVMYCGSDACPSWQLMFSGQRSAAINMLQNEFDHYFIVNHADSNETVVLNDDIWTGAMQAIIEMFRTGKTPVSHDESIAIMKIRERCLQAMNNRGEWLDV